MGENKSEEVKENLYSIISNGKNVYMDGLTAEEAYNAQWEMYRMYPESSFSIGLSNRK